MYKMIIMKLKVLETKKCAPNLKKSFLNIKLSNTYKIKRIIFSIISNNNIIIIIIVIITIKQIQQNSSLCLPFLKFSLKNHFKPLTF